MNLLTEFLLILFTANPIIYLSEGDTNSSGSRCGIEMGGYYNTKDNQIYVCEGHEHYAVSHELGHYFFDEIVSDKINGMLKKYILNESGIINEHNLSDFVFVQEMLADSFKRVVKEQESELDNLQKLDNIVKILLLYYIKEYAK